MGSCVGVSRDRLKYPLRTSSLHASFDVLCGKCWGDVWYGSQPSSWSLHLVIGNGIMAGNIVC
jgi:hypothetical protein